jgi:hypothetical protein
MCCRFGKTLLAPRLLWVFALSFTAVFLFLDIVSLFENDPKIRNVFERDPKYLKCGGSGVGTVAENKTAHIPAPAWKGGCPKVKDLSRADVLNHLDPLVYVDRENDIRNAILHPEDFNSNIMHNFAVVYAPQSSVSKRTGYPWWGVGGLDGNTARNAFLKGIYLLNSKDGITWRPVHGDRPIFTEFDHHYNGFYHSSFDGQNRVVYDEHLDLFYFFTRANVGQNARSWQRSVSRDMECFTTLVPVKMKFFGGRCGGDDNAEQFYTSSVFQLPKMYPGVLFAVPRRHGSHDRGTSSLMHSYDLGASWRRTSGFRPWVNVNYTQMINSWFKDYYYSTFGCGLSEDGKAIEVYIMKERRKLIVQRAPLLQSEKGHDRYRPRVAALKVRAGNPTSFITRKIKFGGRCELFVDFSGNPPQIAVLDSQEREMQAYALGASEIAEELGSVLWRTAKENGATRVLPKADVVRLRVDGEGFELFSITCKAREKKGKMLKQAGEMYAQRLLENMEYRINRTHPNVYLTSTDDYLEYNKPFVFHEFWHGRRDRTIYTLDFHFIEKVVRGSIEFLLTRPEASSTVIYEFPKDTHVIYPQLVNMNYYGGIGAERSSLAPSENGGAKCASRGEGTIEFPLRLFVNAYPLRKLEGGGFSHMHDFFNYVMLHVAKPGDRTKWYVPREIAEKTRKSFCPGASMKCILNFGAFKPSGVFNIRTAGALQQFYRSCIWLLLGMLPFFIFLLCIQPRAYTVQNKWCLKGLKAMVFASFLSLVLSLLSDREIGVFHRGIYRKSLRLSAQ